MFPSLPRACQPTRGKRLRPELRTRHGLWLQPFRGTREIGSIGNVKGVLSSGIQSNCISLKFHQGGITGNQESHVDRPIAYGGGYTLGRWASHSDWRRDGIHTSFPLYRGWLKGVFEWSHVDHWFVRVVIMAAIPVDTTLM